mgnify:CR=1 FL=1
MNYKVSVIVSGIRSDNWTNIYNDLHQQLGEAFQLICCGPNFPSAALASVINFIYIRDFGSPARCFQLASTVATGKYIFDVNGKKVETKRSCNIEEYYLLYPYFGGDETAPHRIKIKIAYLEKTQ